MHPLQMFELIIVMLIAIIGLHYAAAKLRLPPTVALLAGGAIFAFVPGLPVISLDPELALVLFLPPLLMDGAWGMALRHLFRHMFGIIALAVGAVIFTTIVVALVTHWLLPALPWAACAALGAIVSPPDAVSARAVLQNVRLPRRISILLEGESLFNDASGLVLFRFAIAAGVTGMFSLPDALGTFLLLALGGAGVGIAVGGFWVLTIRKLGDRYIMIAATLLVGWIAYLLAELLGVSGVIATVVAGLICGWYQHIVFTAMVRMNGHAFWTVVVFLLEAFVFLLIGSSLRGVIDRVGGIDLVLHEMALPIAAILVALTAARFLWVFGSDCVIVTLRAMGLRRYTPLGPRAGTVLSWAGMRGVVTLAVALSVPAGFPGRDFILVTAFAVIIVTVLLQGTTLGLLIRLVGLVEPESDRAKMTMSAAEAAMAQAQLAVIEANAHDADGKLIHPQLLDRYQRRARAIQTYVGQEAEMSEGLHAHFDMVLLAVAAGRAELLRLHRAGDVDEATLQELERDLDLEELSAISAKA